MIHLIDSNAFIWMGISPDRLSQRAKEALGNAKNQNVVSPATLWELAIKISIGKLTTHYQTFDSFIVTGLTSARAELLPIKLEHIERILSLPFHHRDPFDRMLIAQAMVEGIPIISSDAAFDSYGVKRVW